VILYNCADRIKRWLQDQNKVASYIHLPVGLLNSFAIREYLEWVPCGKQSEHSYAYELNETGMSQWKHEENPWLRDAFKSSGGFILTLGLAEVWRDKVTGGVFWRGVPESIFDENRHESVVSTAQENIENIRAIIDILHSQVGPIPIILTVSPVPLSATMRGVSPIVADCVSKSILRVATESVLQEKRDNVYYWPSFELIRWAGAHTPGLFFFGFPVNSVIIPVISSVFTPQDHKERASSSLVFLFSARNTRMNNAGGALLHIGLRKTGTSTLQRHIFPELCRVNGISYLGKAYDSDIHYHPRKSTDALYYTVPLREVEGLSEAGAGNFFPVNCIDRTGSLRFSRDNKDVLIKYRNQILAPANEHHQLRSIMEGKWFASSENFLSDDDNKIDDLMNLFMILQEIQPLRLIVTLREIAPMVISLYKNISFDLLSSGEEPKDFVDFCGEIRRPSSNGDFRFFRFLMGAPEYDEFFSKVPMIYVDSRDLLASQDSLGIFCKALNLLPPHIDFPVAQENTGVEDHRVDFFERQRQDFAGFMVNGPKLDAFFKKDGIFHTRL